MNNQHVAITKTNVTNSNTPNDNNIHNVNNLPSATNPTDLSGDAEPVSPPYDNTNSNVSSCDNHQFAATVATSNDTGGENNASDTVFE